MVKADIIISWPNNCDYPLWRDFIRKNRDRFNLVIIVFTETNQAPDYREFVKKAMHQDYCLFIDNPPIESGQDWRDVAVKQALIHSFNSEWVWFTEQDFYITGQQYWDTVEDFVNKGFKAIGVMDAQRLHPCSLLLKRELLNRIGKNFGANPPYYDHFGYIQQQLEAAKTDIAIIPSDLYLHMNGLSHNWRLVSEGGKPNYRPEQFNLWVADCLKVGVPLDERWLNTVREYLKRYEDK